MSRKNQENFYFSSFYGSPNRTEHIGLKVHKNLYQGFKVGRLGRQNENGLCLMSICLMKSNCYS